MLSTIQRKGTGHFHQAMDVPTTPKRLSEWIDLDYDERLDMMTLYHEITSFVCIIDSCVMVMEVITILRDFSESRRKVFSGYVGVLYDYNVFSVPAKNGTQLHFVGFHGWGQDNFV